MTQLMAPETHTNGFFSRMARLATGRAGKGARQAARGNAVGNPSGGRSAPGLAMEAAGLAASLPALVAEAERIAATVSAGLHGQKRAGPGETFWQYRPALPGEPVTRIDWRQSARGHRAYVRETEAEHAQTFYLWCDLSASMRWSSSGALPLKQDRALLLVLALAALLERSGERVRLLSEAGRVELPAGGGRIASRLAVALGRLAGLSHPKGVPTQPVLPANTQLVVVSDFLDPEAEIATLFRRLAGAGIRTCALQVTDPAELTLPYSGRVRFEGLEGEADVTIPAVETVGDEYVALRSAREAALRTVAERCRHVFLIHRTSESPAMALLGAASVLTGHRAGHGTGHGAGGRP